MVHDGMVSFEQARDGMLAVMAIVEAEAGELVPIGVGPKEAALRVFNRLARGDSVFDDAIDKLTKRQFAPEMEMPLNPRGPMDLPAIWTDPPEDPDVIENVESRSIVDPAGELCWVQVGCEVRLKGLRSSPELNGRVGIVKKWYPKRERFEVNLLEKGSPTEDRETPPLAVKPENMDKVGDWGAGGRATRMEAMGGDGGDGHGVVAARTRDADERDNLLCERVYASAMLRGHKTKRCHRCFDLLKPGEPRIECPCGSGRYCSHECRRAAWSDPGDHCRMECAGGGLLWTSLIPTEFVLATRAVRKDRDEVKRNIKRTRRWVDLDWRGAWRALEESDDPDATTKRASVVAFSLLAARCSGLGDVKDLMFAALAVMANTFGVKKPDWPSRLHRDGVDDASTELDKLEDWRVIFNMSESTVAMGLFLDASLMNHSCVPNCFANFGGREIRIHNVREVREGEEFTISYGPVVGSDTPTGRGEALHRSHGFRCQCEGCVDQRDQDFSDFKAMRKRASELDDEARRLVNGGDDDRETMFAAAKVASNSLENLNAFYYCTWERDDPESSLTLALEFVRFFAVASARAGCWAGTGTLSDASRSRTLFGQDLVAKSKEPFYTLTRYAGRDPTTDGIVERACTFLCLMHKYHSPLGFGGLR
jgi:SET and MYND domain-containing protein